MTDLKPISSSKGDAPNLGTTNDPNSAKLRLTPYVQSTAPAKPAQTNRAQTTVPTKTSPAAKGQPDSSDAPCTQPGCPGTIADGYCDVCGIPATPTVGAAMSTEPTQPSGAETAAATKANLTAKGPADSSDAPCTQPGCPGTVADGYCDVCGSPATPTVEPTASTEPTQTNPAQTTVPTRPSTKVTHTTGSTEPAEPSAAEAAAAAFRAAQAAAEAFCRPRPAVSQPAPTTKPLEQSAAEAGTFTQPGTAKTESQAPPNAAQTRGGQTPMPTTPNSPTTSPTARTEPAPASAEAAGPSERSPTGAQAPVLSPPSLAEADSAAKPAKRRRVLPIVLASVASTLVAVLALAALLINQVERSLTQNLDREDLLPTDSKTAPHPTKEAGAGDALNFVVMGYDSRDPSIEHSGSLMILHLNAKRDQAYLITFPRDTWVSIPGRGNDKINSAYRFGGPKLTVSTLEQLTDTRIDHAVLVDFQGFARLTDAVGGVTVYNKTGFSTHGFDYPKGNITVSGDRALYFVGERDSLPRGDFDRTANERNLVRAIIAKSLSAKTLSDPRRLFSIVSGAAEHLTVDKSLTSSSIRSTIFSLRLTNKDVHLMKAPVSGKATRKGQRVDLVHKAKLAELRSALRDDRVNVYLAKYPQG
jgi:polyisoprenyl-teichoic acid--peptidoglycan teichoic acid transferase